MDKMEHEMETGVPKPETLIKVLPQRVGAIKLLKLVPCQTRTRGTMRMVHREPELNRMMVTSDLSYRPRAWTLGSAVTPQE